MLLAVDLKSAAVGVDVLAHIIILGQVEQLADLWGAAAAAAARARVRHSTGLDDAHYSKCSKILEA